jgi:replicative DNA helicase
MDMMERYIVAALMSDKTRLTVLHRVESWMIWDKELKRLFKVLKVADDKIKDDMIKLRELADLKASTVADMVIIRDDIKWGGILITDDDINQWVDAKYLKAIEEYTQKGEIGKIQKVISKMTMPQGKSVKERYLEYEEDFSKATVGGLLGFSTGLDSLDNTTLGLIKGQIWVVGAYYGYGKTFMMLNMVESAIKQGKKTLVFSLEMTAEEILARLICLRAKLGPVEVFCPLGKDKSTRRNEAREYWLKQIEEGMLTIEDEARGVDDIVVKLASGGEYDFVCLDYVQLLSGEGSQYEMLRDGMKTLQMVTKKYQFTLLLLSQISNEAQKAGSGSLVDGFKGAGDIGQVANVAMRIMREKDEETGEWGEFFGLNITKVRHGVGKNLSFKIEFPGGRIIDEDPLATFEGM